MVDLFILHARHDKLKVSQDFIELILINGWLHTRVLAYRLEALLDAGAGYEL